MKAIITFFFLLFTMNCVAQKSDTIFVKNVFIGNQSVEVKKGYILKHRRRNNIYLVNGKILKLRIKIATNDEKYKETVTNQK